MCVRVHRGFHVAADVLIKGNRGLSDRWCIHDLGKINNGSGFWVSAAALGQWKLELTLCRSLISTRKNEQR